MEGFPWSSPIAETSFLLPEVTPLASSFLESLETVKQVQSQQDKELANLIKEKPRKSGFPSEKGTFAVPCKLKGRRET